VIDRLAGLVEQRTSRRGLLARTGIAASALAVAPLRYLLRPESAWAIIRPSDCGSGACTDGYTAFCCELGGGANQCPPNSYIAGWWKCTDYRGRGLCHGHGVRYYVDCNRSPGHASAGGCHCARHDCNRRRVDCNQFRYGQCNTHIQGETEVVCRIVVCEHPGSIAEFNCNATVKVDDTTCTHNQGCLEPLVVELPGGGGV